jgi:hypothetical protein
MTSQASLAEKRLLDKEQKAVLDYLLNVGSCYITGPPGTGKTVVFEAIAENWKSPGVFLPFTRAATGELIDRLPYGEWEVNGEIVRYPLHSIVIATVNSFCSRCIGYWPGSYEKQLEEFLKMEDKEKYSLVGVDEIQDFRPLHWEVTKSVMDGLFFGAGDPCQTIFTFGDAMGYKVFEELEKLGYRKFELYNNYRSGKDIVSILNQLYPRDIKPMGPKTYGRIAVFSRGHERLQVLSKFLESENIPHSRREPNGKDTVILKESNLYLMVTHACKGLGFDKVYQFDWALPNKSSPKFLEEYNLLYVAVARASKEFYLVDGEFNTYLEDSKARFISTSELIKELKREVRVL